MKVKDVEGAKRRWVQLCDEDDLGLWWIARDMRELMPGASDEELRRETLSALRALMKVDAIRAAVPLESGEFEMWNGTVDEQLARIDAAWRVLGRAPNIGDIVWFVGPRRWRH